MTIDVKRKLEAELGELESELRIHLPKEIKRALEFGDLRENSEYQTALQRQTMVKARIRELRQRISEISSIDLSRIPRDKAAYGSTLLLYDSEREEEVTYRLVTPEEKDRLLDTYWTVPARQRETSAVLVSTRHPAPLAVILSTAASAQTLTPRRRQASRRPL